VQHKKKAKSGEKKGEEKGEGKSALSKGERLMVPEEKKKGGRPT